MLWSVFAGVAVYLAGWFLAVRFFSGMEGPVPVPGRWRRDVRDGMVWPLWLILFTLLWLIALRPQAFEQELGSD